MLARANRSWYPDEDGQLIREHKHNKYKVEKMALLHKRPVEEITRRLRRLGLVKAPVPVIDTTKAEVAEILYDMVAAIESIKPFVEHEVTVFEPLATVSESEVTDLESPEVTVFEPEVTVLEPEVTVSEPPVTVSEPPVTVSEPEVTFLMKISDYTKAGDTWSEDETKRLLELYRDKELCLLAISALHLRTPSSIICKLRKMNVEKDQASVRGFSEYKNSILYKEVCLLKKQKKHA